MAYDVWISLQARDALRYIEDNESEIHQQIWDELNGLAVDREDFRKSPEKFESFAVGKRIIIYRVAHRMRGIDVVEIIELP